MTAQAYDSCSCVDWHSELPSLSLISRKVVVDGVNEWFWWGDFDLKLDLLAKDLAFWALEGQVNGVDCVRITDDLRVDSEWDRQIERLLALHVFVDGDTDWFDWAVGHDFSGIKGKFASLFPGPVSVVEDLDVCEGGGTW